MSRNGVVLIVTILAAGCATNHYEERPFFQHEYELTSHGRKTLFDRIVEVDPGRINVDVSPEYLNDPPERIAVLPFTDEGSANFVVDKIALTYRSKKQRYNWAWTDAQRLRRAMQGYLAQREFLLANLIGVDTVMQERNIRDMADLRRVSAQELGQWLGVDAVMYGKVLHYEGYYFGPVAAWNVGIEVELVSSHNGKTLVHATVSRYDVSLLPAMDLQDILINSAQNILQLRDINLARAEEEACREVVKRIPVSNTLKLKIAAGARDHVLRVVDHRPQTETPGIMPAMIGGSTYSVIRPSSD